MFAGYMKLYRKIKWLDALPRVRVYPMKQNRQCRQRPKFDVVKYYSHGTMKCAYCGEEDIIVLTIDHINNDGAKDRKEIARGTGFYRWLKKHDYPDGFQVLCRNCNYRKYIKSLEEKQE